MFSGKVKHIYLFYKYWKWIIVMYIFSVLNKKRSLYYLIDLKSSIRFQMKKQISTIYCVKNKIKIRVYDLRLIYFNFFHLLIFNAARKLAIFESIIIFPNEKIFFGIKNIAYFFI